MKEEAYSSPSASGEPAVLKERIELLERELAAALADRAAIMEKQGKLVHILENISDVVFMVDHRGVLTYVSPGVKDIWGYGEEELYKDENYVETFDDDYDNTYATYRFKVPEKWKSDFHLITSGMLNKVSDEYVNHVKNFYPKLAELGIVNKIFRSNDNEEVSNN